MNLTTFFGGKIQKGLPMYYYLINVLQLNWTHFSVLISVKVSINKETLDALINSKNELLRIPKQHQDMHDKYQEQRTLNRKPIGTLQASDVFLKRNKNTDELH